MPSLIHTPHQAGRWRPAIALICALCFGSCRGLPYRLDELHRLQPQRRTGDAAAALPVVQEAAPNLVLECLLRHRLTALACTRADELAPMNISMPPPSPPAQQCGDSTFDAICAAGRGRCAYDSVRGWHCACDDATASSIRGHPTAQSNIVELGCIR